MYKNTHQKRTSDMAEQHRQQLLLVAACISSITHRPLIPQRTHEPWPGCFQKWYENRPLIRKISAWSSVAPVSRGACVTNVLRNRPSSKCNQASATYTAGSSYARHGTYSFIATVMHLSRLSILKVWSNCHLCRKEMARTAVECTIPPPRRALLL